MILPALVPLVRRQVRTRPVNPLLSSPDATNTLSWVVGITGVLLVIKTWGKVL